MNNQAENQQWQNYIETGRRTSQPTKIDLILQQRMQSFIAARRRKLHQTEG